MSENTTTRQHRRALALCVLLTIALIGVAIGSWVYGALRQRALVAAIRAGHDAEVSYRYELDKNTMGLEGAKPPGPNWLRDWLGIDFFDHVAGITIQSPDNASLRPISKLSGLRLLQLVSAQQVDDEGIAQLEHLPALERLYVDASPLTVRGAKTLAGLPRLRILNLPRCDQLDDAGLSEISKISGLTWLSISGNRKVTTVGLARLNQLKKLQSLSLEFHSGATDAALEQLQSLVHLRELGLDYEPGGLAGGLKFLGGFSGLEAISLKGNVEFSDADLTALPELPQLHTLDIECLAAPKQGLNNLKQLSKLRELGLTRLLRFDDAAIADIATLSGLEDLTLFCRESEITDTALESIGKMAGLRTLWLILPPNLTDEGLKHLEGLTNLKVLTLFDSQDVQFSLPAVDALRAALPQCKINHNEFSPEP